MNPISVSAPDEFSFNPDEWKKWLTRFERFLMVSGYNEKSEEVKVATLIYTMGPRAEEIFNSFGLADAEAKVYKTVLDKFKGHFEPKNNVIFKRAMFNKRVQLEGEPVHKFITDLQTLATDCEYGNLKDQLIRDRIVVGIRDGSLSERMQLDLKLTLESAMSMAKNKELIHAQNESIRNDDKPEVSVNKISGASGTKFKSSNSREPQPSKWKCYFCASSKRHNRDQCPAKKSRCNNCSTVGHYAVVCKKPKRVQKQVNQVQNYDEEETEFFLGSVENENRNSDWYAEIRISKGTKNFENFIFKIDSGACVTCVPYSCYSPDMGVLCSTQHSLIGASGDHLSCMGYQILEMVYKNCTIKQKIYFVKGLKTCLLGRPAIEGFGLIKRVNEIDKSDTNWTDMYPSLFRGLGCMKGEYNIKLAENVVPFSISTSRRVPFPLLSKVKLELDKMVQEEVIEPITSPTEWCAPMVVIPKASGSVRICGDFTELNKNIVRERFELPTVEATLAKLSGAKIFSKLDANSGFYQIKINPGSAPLTCFMTPFGRYFYKRLPMGISSAPEHYMRKMAQITDSLPGTLCLMDDICVFGATQQEHDERLHKILKILSAEGVTLNKEKCKFSVESLNYLGHVIDAEGVRADPAKVQAVTLFPVPKNVKDIQRFLGMVNQLAKFIPNISDLTKPFRELLSKKCEFIWTDIHERSFEKLKNVLKSSPVLRHYDVNKPVTLATDASSYGLGAVMYQDHGGNLQPIAYASRSLQPAETRYAAIEAEALAILWACEHFQQYLVGKKFQIQTDHSPLLSILKTKPIGELSPRLQRFRLRLLRFDYDIEYISGKKHIVPDCMSRAPVKSTEKDDHISVDEISEYCRYVVGNFPITDTQLETLKCAQNQDPIVNKIKNYCTGSWPQSSAIPFECKYYASLQSELAVIDDLLVKGNRLVIPPSMRKNILSKIHEGHLGMTKCLGRMRETVWWPNATQEMKDFISKCEVCCRLSHTRREPMLPSEVPAYPCQKIACDYFTWNAKSYFLIVDYLSKWVEIYPMSTTTSSETISKLKGFFSNFGIAVEVVTDGGPQFVSHEFSLFSKKFGFKHVITSPYYSQANGEAERAVKTVKTMFQKCKLSKDDPYLALLNYRTSPLQNGSSPAEIMFGRKLRTSIPTTEKVLSSRRKDFSEIYKKEGEYKEKMKAHYDGRRGVRANSPLKIGERVYLTRDKVDGTITSTANTPRSYNVRTEGGEKRRNRVHIRPLPPTNENSPAEKEDTSFTQSTTLRRSQRPNFGLPPERFCC